MITTVNGWVLVKPIDEDTTTKSGLYVPVTATLIRKGMVICCSDTSEEKCPAVVGDVIVFHKAAGLEIRENDDVFLVLKLDAIMGKVTGNEAK